MDIWIVSFKESLLDFIAKEMKAYRLYTVVPRLTKFIDQLTNWYVRMNRKRIKGDLGVEDCYHALDSLYDILMAMVKIMAPFTPYLTEYMYQRLRLLDDKLKPGSVHYEMMPVTNKAIINLPIERAVARMQAVVELGRVMRDRRTVPIKYPLTEVVVIHQTQEYLDDINSLQDFIASELNIRSVVLSMDKKKYDVTLRAEPDHKLLGIRLKNDVKTVTAAIKALTDVEIQTQMKKGFFEVAGHRIEMNEIRVIYQFGGGADTANKIDYEAHSDNDVLVLLNMMPNQELVDEGTARELINRVQRLKKKAKLVPTDTVLVYYKINKPDSDVKKVAQSHQAFIENIIKSKFQEHNAETDLKEVIIEETSEIKDVELKLRITTTKERVLPKVPFVNLVLSEDLKIRYVNGDCTTKTASLNLMNFAGKILTVQQLKSEVEMLFGLFDTQFNITATMNKQVELTNLTMDLAGKTLFVVKKLNESKIDQSLVSSTAPFSKFINAELSGKSFTVYTENPSRCNEMSQEKIDVILKTLFGVDNVGKLNVR